jgi:uncharacterized protein YecE (DUF72 family)
MTTSHCTPNFPFALGCPVWSCDQWNDVVYPRRTPRREWLTWYSRMFNTVECNSTFYALPTLDIARRWADETADGFKFCLKFPRGISHEGRLEGSSLLDQFVEIVAILHAKHRAGPSFLQLPPWFDSSRLEELVQFLGRLPTQLHWAVEPRHESWFLNESAEQHFNEALASLGMDRVIFDSRALFQSPPDDEIEKISQKRKPNAPVRFTRTGARPLVRIVGRNQIELADHFVAEWLPIIDQWLNEGTRPYIFTHAPDDKFAPAFARRFAKAFVDQSNREQIQLPSLPPVTRQMTLFDDA